MSPEDGSNELQEGDDVEGPNLGARGLAVEEEVEELQADGMALNVKPLGTTLLACDFMLNTGVGIEKFVCRQIMNYRTSFPDLECQLHAFVHS